jgi:fluoride exporter
VEKLTQVALLSLGGVFGVNARYWFGVWVTRNVSLQFPLATFLINVSGSFAIGFLTTLLINWLPHPHFRLLVVTGFLGGYTTYSSFAFESLVLWERGERATSVAYVSLTVIAGLLAVSLGVQLARQGIAFQNQRATVTNSIGTTQSPLEVPKNIDPDLEPEAQP